MTTTTDWSIDATTGEITETEREVTPEEEESARQLVIWRLLRGATYAQVEAMSEAQFRRAVLKILKMLGREAIEDD